VGTRHRKLGPSRLEWLEERCLLSTFVVTNNTDSGPGSLRQAIVSANGNPGADTINFGIKVGAIAEAPIPGAASGPLGITSGSDGNLWFTQSTSSEIGRITPSGAISEFALPADSVPTGITAGPDGNVWFTENYSDVIGRITPTGTITPFPLYYYVGDPEGITAGPDGKLWFTATFDGGSRIGSITTSGDFSAEYDIEDRYAAFDITTGSDGNLWFTQPDGNEIGTLNPTTGAQAEFSLPTAGSYPTAITSGPDGNLWFTEQDSDQIGMINPTTHVIHEFPLPTAASAPTGITDGPDGNLWFSERDGNQIGMINPTTHAIAEFPIPTASSLPAGITAGADGNVWFAEYGGNQIGRVTVDSSGLTIAPGSSLPSITSPATIDATTQPGFAGRPIIDLNGADAGTSVNGLTIAAGGGGSTIRGLVINDFSGTLSESTGAGVLLLANGNVVEGDFIGTDRSGTVALANSDAGVLVDSSGNTVGGLATGAGNVISGNGTAAGQGLGVDIFGATSAGNLVVGNEIGTNVDGTRAITGSGIGVLIDGAPGNVVANNVISGNQEIGVEIAGATASGNVLQGNRIGTNQAGNAAIPNGADGIFINNAPANTIGGSGSGAGNLVAGNGEIGIQIFGLGARRNLIANNTLGRSATGRRTAGLLNGNAGDLGIYVNTTPNVNTITGNIGQGQRESPTGAPFIPGVPAAGSGASARAAHRGEHGRHFAHRPFFKVGSAAGQGRRVGRGRALTATTE
jgi:virginiamycin B lyase